MLHQGCLFHSAFSL